MLFFQLVLLAGYIYAHWLINYLSPKIQLFTHIMLIGLSLILLPVVPNYNLRIMSDVDPILHLLILLLTSVGLPYFLLSTTSPLLQSWYAKAYQKAIPYRLFALSNLSSLLGLLAYPFLIEPHFTLSQQSNGWSVAYAVFAGACIITTLHGFRFRNAETAETGSSMDMSEEATVPPTVREKTVWLLLATCASILLLSTTNYLTQNVASIPFLWILPLSLYLFSFTLCFDRSGWYRRNWYVWIITAAIGAMAFVITQWGHSYNIMVTIPLFCAGLFLCCMFCHGELAVRKPAPKYLTTFYMMISIGGAAGGVLVSVVVPKVLSGPFELAIALNACAFLLFAVNFRKRWFTDAVCALLIIGVLGTTGYYIHSFTERSQLLVRDFYGCLKVDVINKGTDDEFRSLVHGTITHGIQFSDAARRNGHFSYYSDSSGVGMAINSLRPGPRRIGIIGLGVGALSSYARKGDTFRFYEIDSLVKKVAMREFSYLADCRGKVEILIGDGRLTLEQEKDQKYDLMVVDAFSSDSIPVHLLTVEALKLYFRHLKTDGILALHISNHHLDLAPVIELARAALEKQAVLIRGEGNDDTEIYSSDWVLMTSARDLLKVREIRKAAAELDSKPGLRLWTDDYSNLIQILK
jgi:spermidine synthase